MINGKKDKHFSVIFKCSEYTALEAVVWRCSVKEVVLKNVQFVKQLR